MRTYRCREARVSRDQILDHRAAELAELFEATGMVKGELLLVISFFNPSASSPPKAPGRSGLWGVGEFRAIEGRNRPDPVGESTGFPGESAFVPLERGAGSSEKWGQVHHYIGKRTFRRINHSLALDSSYQKRRGLTHGCLSIE